MHICLDYYVLATFSAISVYYIHFIFVEKLAGLHEHAKGRARKHIHIVTQDITKTMKPLGLQGQNNRVVQKQKLTPLIYKHKNQKRK